MANGIYTRPLKSIRPSQSVSFRCSESHEQSITLFLCLFWQMSLTERQRREKMNLNISFTGDNQLQGLTPTVLQKAAALGTIMLCTCC